MKTDDFSYRITRLALAFLLGCFLAGCGSGEEINTAVVVDDGIGLVSPQQIQTVLQQLDSENAKQQIGGLNFVDRYPSLIKTHRHLIQRLSDSGGSQEVKQRASEMLDSRDQ